MGLWKIIYFDQHVNNTKPGYMYGYTLFVTLMISAMIIILIRKLYANTT